MEHVLQRSGSLRLYANTFSWQQFSFKGILTNIFLVELQVLDIFDSIYLDYGILFQNLWRLLSSQFATTSLETSVGESINEFRS